MSQQFSSGMITNIQQLMISECSSKKYDGINAGFFKGIGRHGRIVQV